MPTLNQNGENRCYFLENTPEVPIPVEGITKGEIPTWLRGRVMACAPALFNFPQGSYNHFFDGMTQMMKLEINGETQKITFTSKFLQSKSYKKNREAGRPMSVEYGTNPSALNKKGLFSKLKPFGPYDSSDNPVGTILPLGTSNTKELYVMSETSYFYKINGHTLDTLEQCHTLKAYGMNSINPFMQKDPKDDSLYTIGSSLASTGLIKYHILRKKVDAKKLESLCTVQSRWYSCLSLPRCVAITEHYVIFVEQPAIFNAVKMAAMNLKGYNVRDVMEWKENESNRFFVVAKDSGKLILGQKFHVQSKINFNTVIVINAFEDGDDNIIFDIVTTNGLEMLDASNLENLHKMSLSKSSKPSQIRRFIIPLKIPQNFASLPENENLLQIDKRGAKAYRHEGSLIIEPYSPLGDTPLGIDWGMINPQFISRKYRHFFATSCLFSINSSPYFGKIVKVDMDNGQVLAEWSPHFQKFVYVVCNPLFVPRSGGGDECEKDLADDDGVIITLCLTINKEEENDMNNFLVILDGKSMKEIARSEFNVKIPLWVHPNFIE